MKAFLGLDTSEFTTGIGRVQESVSRLSRGALSGTFRNIAADIASANSPAEALAATFNSLGNAFRGTIFGAAGLAIGKLLAAPFEQLSIIVKESGAAVDQVLSKIERAGSVANVQQGLSEMASLQQAADQVSKSIQSIDSNVFLRMASFVSGAKNEMEAMRETLQRLGNARVLEGITRENQNAAFRRGLSPEDQRLFDVSENTRARVESVRRATTPGAAQDAAILQAFEIGARERNDLLDKIAKEKAQEEFREKERLAKAYAQLVSDFDETLSNRRRRKENEAHEDRMKKAKEALDMPIEAAAATGAATPAPGSPLQVLADSLQQVGGGGRFAQVGGNETKDYLRAIKDSSAVSAKALQEMAGTNRGSVTPLGVE
jgi:hypothetical protein